MVHGWLCKHVCMSTAVGCIILPQLPLLHYHVSLLGVNGMTERNKKNSIHTAVGGAQTGLFRLLANTTHHNRHRCLTPHYHMRVIVHTWIALHRRRFVSACAHFRCIYYCILFSIIDILAHACKLHLIEFHHFYLIYSYGYGIIG